MQRRTRSPIDPWTGQRPDGPATGLYCRACHYDLQASFDAGRCPVCRAEFQPGDPASYLERLPAPTRWSTYVMWVLVVAAIALFAATGIQVMAAAQRGGH